MPRCGCASGGCACVGDNVTITGAGSAGDPFVAVQSGTSVLYETATWLYGKAGGGPFPVQSGLNAPIPSVSGVTYAAACSLGPVVLGDSTYRATITPGNVPADFSGTVHAWWDIFVSNADGSHRQRVAMAETPPMTPGAPIPIPATWTPQMSEGVTISTVGSDIRIESSDFGFFWINVLHYLVAS